MGYAALDEWGGFLKYNTTVPCDDQIESTYFTSLLHKEYDVYF